MEAKGTFISRECGFGERSFPERRYGVFEEFFQRRNVGLFLFLGWLTLFLQCGDIKMSKRDRMPDSLRDVLSLFLAAVLLCGAIAGMPDENVPTIVFLSDADAHVILLLLM